MSYIVARVLERRKEELAELERDTAPLERVQAPFPRISYSDAVARLNQLGSDINWGDDLGGDDETLLAKEYDRPLFVFNWRYVDVVPTWFRLVLLGYRELRLALLTTRQFPVRTIRELCDASALQRFYDLQRVRVVAGSESDEFTWAQLLGHLDVLHHYAESSTPGNILRFTAEQSDLAGIGFDEAEPQRDRSGLPGAVGPEHS